jgi:hypothetical protein
MTSLITLLAIVLTVAQGQSELFRSPQWEPEQEPYLRRSWGCAETESTEDCAKRIQAEAMEKFFAENCEPSEIFETCEKRVILEMHLFGTRKPSREALGCIEDEELPICQERVQTEARKAYRLWLHQQGIDQEQAFADLTAEESAAFEAAGLDPPDPPVFDHEAMRWYVCGRIARGEIPPPVIYGPYTPRTDGEPIAVDHCEHAFDPLRWREPE